MNKQLSTALAMTMALACAAGISDHASGQASSPGPSAYRRAIGIPQPHFLEARRLADEENFWKNAAMTICYRDDQQLSQVIIKDPAPTKMTDNIYFLGDGYVSAWAVDTPGGIVMIDSLNNKDEVDKYIIGGMKKLGLDPTRIKDIIVSHGHSDHYGGAQYLKDKYGATIYMGEKDWDYAGPHAQGRTPDRPAGPVPTRDKSIKDGDSLTIGGTTIRMFLSPGHTPSPVSLLIPTTYQGKPHMVVFHGAVMSGEDGYAVFDNAQDRLIAAAQQAHADGYMGNHPSFDDVARKVAHRQADPNGADNEFLPGEATTIRWLKIIKECNLNNWDLNKAFTARGQAPGPGPAGAHPPAGTFQYD